MTFHSQPIILVRRLLCAVAFAAALPAQTYTLFGTGCPGSAGVPALHANGLPVIGFTMQVDLTQVPTNSVGVLLFGLSLLPNPLDLGFIGAPGCRVYSMPDLATMTAIATNGAAAVNLALPLQVSLVGAAFNNQWLDIDPSTNTITTSNGGHATIGALPPAITIGAFSPTSGVVGVGTVFTIRTTNLGTNDPNDLCMQLSDITGLRSLLRATSIVPDFVTGEDVITATMVVANGSPVAVINLVLMRGDGAQSSTAASSCLTTPASAWAWGGTALPGAGAGTPTGLVPIPAATTQNVQFAYDAGSNSLIADVPPYPWAFSGLYPPNSSITTDAHGDLACGGGTPGGHFDQFVETAQVKPTCAGGITNQQLVIEHAPQLQQALNNWFGPGRVTVTAQTPGAMARIRIQPTNPNCVLTGGGGSVVLGQ